LKSLLADIKNCSECSTHLEPNPVLTAHPNSKIILIGQAPGLKVHQSGIPWDDKSGDNLRNWMGVDKQTFYNPEQIALIPMGFCYPGKGKSGDRPPRKECAPLWHHQLFEKMPNVELTILVGQYAHQKYLGDARKHTLTETVKNFHEYLPKFFVLPHPSPRNNIWQAKNPWFAKEVLPLLKLSISKILGFENPLPSKN